MLLIRLISLSDIHICISVAAHDTLQVEQILSHTRTTIVDTITSLQDSGWEVIPVSEVHDILTQIHDNLDKVDNVAHILAFLFNLLPGSVMKCGWKEIIWWWVWHFSRF